MLDQIRGGGVVVHNILQYTSKVVYFQNSTISKTYVCYVTIMLYKYDKVQCTVKIRTIYFFTNWWNT